MIQIPLKKLAHSRITPMVPVPLEQIKGDPNFVEDPLFTKFFISMMRGESPLALSRLSEKKITGGFYRWESGGPKLIQSLSGDKDIQTMMAHIRQGHRPALYLYWSRINPKPDKFVCPDDQNVLEAYRRLNIKKVPVRIMAPKVELLEEGAILIGSEKKPTFGSRAPKWEHYEGSFATATPQLATVLDEFELRFNAAASQIQSFDWSKGREPHYHQFLRAACLRASRLLGSIRLLCAHGSVDHAFALARLLYEASINTYIDWLAPDWVGPRFQYLSIMARANSDRVNGRKRKFDIPDVIEEPVRNFLESVEQKARLYPATSHFYRVAYPRLSSTAHQDYRALEDTEIERLMDDPQDLHREETLANWLDAICTPVLRRLEDDCGFGLR